MVFDIVRQLPFVGQKNESKSLEWVVYSLTTHRFFLCPPIFFLSFFLQSHYNRVASEEDVYEANRRAGESR